MVELVVNHVNVKPKTPQIACLGNSDIESSSDLDDNKDDTPHHRCTSKADNSKTKSSSSNNNNNGGGGGVCGGLMLEFAIPGQDNQHVPIMIELADDMLPGGDIQMMELHDSFKQK
jgi:hypothetical protein